MKPQTFEVKIPKIFEVATSQEPSKKHEKNIPLNIPKQPGTLPKDPFVCPKKGINPNQSYCGNGIGTIKPTRSGRGWILLGGSSQLVSKSPK